MHKQLQVGAGGGVGGGCNCVYMKFGPLGIQVYIDPTLKLILHESNTPEQTSTKRIKNQRKERPTRSYKRVSCYNRGLRRA